MADDDITRLGNKASKLGRDFAGGIPEGITETGGMLAAPVRKESKTRPLSSITEKPSDSSDFFYRRGGGPMAPTESPLPAPMGRQYGPGQRMTEEAKYNLGGPEGIPSGQGVSREETAGVGGPEPKAGIPSEAGRDWKSEYGFKWAEPETAATRAGDEAARRRIPFHVELGGEEGAELASRRRWGDVTGKETDAQGRMVIPGYEKGGGGMDGVMKRYQDTLSALGGKPNLKTRMGLMSEIMRDEETRAETTRKYKEMEMAHGETSPAMREVGLRESELRLRAAIAPAEIKRHLANVAKIEMETKGVSSQIAMNNARAKYLESMSETPDVKRVAGELNILKEALKDTIPETPDHERIWEQILQRISHAKSVNKAVEEYNKKHGTSLSPDQFESTPEGRLKLSESTEEGQQ